jgi:hypothetical protein
MPSPSYYIESEDFTAQSKSLGGGGRGHKKDKHKPDGKYNSKHIRIALEKKNASTK